MSIVSRVMHNTAMISNQAILKMKVIVSYGVSMHNNGIND